MLQKKSAPLNFSGGIDTKTDSKQLAFGKFERLVNMIFTTLQRLTKRPGYKSLASLPEAASYLTTFNGNLTALKTSLQSYAKGSNSWINNGNFQPMSLSVLPLVRSALSQITCDSVISPNGFVCVVYGETLSASTLYRYGVLDSTTGQYVLNPTLIPPGSGVVTGSPRAFLLGGYFIIAFTNVISGVSNIQYIAISTNNPTSATTPADIASNYTSATTVSWDGVVVGSQLFVAYNTQAGGQQVQITYLTTGFTVATPVSFTGSTATIMSVTADITAPSAPVIYATFWDSGGSIGNAVAVDQNLNKLMTATQWLGSGSILNVATTAQNGVLSIIYENANNYSYDTSIPSHFLDKNTITLPATVTTGTVGSALILLRSLGLASKGFLFNSKMYVLAVYQSPLQSTYFLIDIDDNIIARFAYENAGGYLTTGLPYAQVIDTTVSIPYLFKDLIQSQNTQGLVESIGPAGATNIYSQTGVNMINLDFTSDDLSTAEIGQNLNINGGYLWAYDGQTLAEQGFHLFPDNVEATALADPGPTGNTVMSSATLTGVSSVAGIIPGMTVTDVTNSGAIPANTTVVSVGTTTVVMSAQATASHSGDTLLFTGNMSAQQYYYQVTYEWTDAQGNIVRSAPSIPVSVTTTSGHTSVNVSFPSLRLTNKPRIKCVIYRWSAAQQVYYQITSLTNPIINSKGVNSFTYEDIASDAQILGNNIIYTTGGVLENIAGPAFKAVTLFDNRLWGISSENDLLWFSKQVIQGVPVEMSDLLTDYVAPTIGAQGSTGPLETIFPMDDKLILGKKDAFYYMNGTGPDNTGANNQYSQPIFITSNVGCANQNSYVMVPQGLMSQSDKGIWLLGRDLSTKYIGADVESFNGFAVNSAVSIPATTYVLFTLSSGSTLMYDYFVSQWGEWDGVPAISSTLYEGLHTYINSDGTVAQQTPGLYRDNGNPVLMSFVTSWLNLTGLQGYQRAYFFYLLGEFITPHMLQVGLAYDYNPSFYTAPLINPINSTLFYGGVGPYGQQNNAVYGGGTSLEQWRVFHKRQRCQAFQISLQEIYNSSFGIPAGEGLTLSGINLIYGSKQSFRPTPANKSVG